MSGFVCVQLEVEDLTTTMLSDGAFLEEVITEIAEGFLMGALVDNTMDLFRELPPEKQELWLTQFGLFVDYMKSNLEIS